jgi:hypothetical protein
MEEEHVPQANATPPPPPLQLGLATPHLAYEMRQPKSSDPKLDAGKDDASLHG